MEQFSDPHELGRTDLSGTWRSWYEWAGPGAEGARTEEHTVQVMDHGERVDIVSLQDPSGSRITIALAMTGLKAAGKWREVTRTRGQKPSEHSGTLELIVDGDGKVMNGTWKEVVDGQETSGPWTFERMNGRTGGVSAAAGATLLQLR